MLEAARRGDTAGNRRTLRVAVRVKVLTSAWGEPVPKPVKFLKTGIYDGSQ